MGLGYSALAALIGVHVFVSQAVAAEPNLSGSFDALTDVNMLQEYGEAKMPSGLVNLCARQPEFCQPREGSSRRLILSDDRWKLITAVNSQVNRQVESTTDQLLYGQLEYWTLPGASGDCEDFVLLKRQKLVQLGLPESTLLITVVLDENGEGHAILTIPTTSGDLVLDNRRDEVRFWRTAGYTFLKRQSAVNPNRWVSLGRQRLQATNFASGPEAP